MKKKSRINLSTTQTILLSFLLAILAGSALLALPVSSADGIAVPYIDALFTATTSICVTGLVTVPTFSTWSLFGQIIILFLIQIGGLGVVTIMSGLMISLHRRIGIKDRMLIQDAFNLNTLSGMVKFIRKVIAGTFLVEGIGALLYMTVFVPEFGVKGVWISLFNAVSAFCNAGMDVISENSLYAYVHNPVINIVTILLIVFGGIGYIVWWDIMGVLKNIRRQGLKCFANLTFHSKIALSVTGILILAGTAAVFIFEYNNPLTMYSFSVPEKLQASLFQSVTTRTAGFATVPQENLTNASALTSLLLMFIGGSPVGTAGGIKTVTFAVLITSAFATMKTRSEAELFHRTIPKQAVSKAVAVVSMAFIILFTATLLLAAVTDADALDIVYETVSAAATVGLTRSLTSELNIWGRIIIIITMYLGRVGPISLMIALNTKKETKNIIKNPTEDISVG
ncbi:MAG: potassium transporter KtrB [Lachnospiraceae bacterium]|jgi:trk system potassium uptake protein TrkH|nr:potassium transporter KtrB [Lachnospiraceae bacterium]MCI9396444.1 potassium transporter KtrB [Lachnospiraceae bacterium]